MTEYKAFDGSMARKFIGVGEPLFGEGHPKCLAKVLFFIVLH
jgi:hypothetical protein